MYLIDMLMIAHALWTGKLYSIIKWQSFCENICEIFCIQVAFIFFANLIFFQSWIKTGITNFFLMTSFFILITLDFPHFPVRMAFSNSCNFLL